MVITSSPWLSSPSTSSEVSLVQISPLVLNALAEEATEFDKLSSTDFTLTPYITGPECIGVWKRRSAQVKANPGDAIWVTRLIVHPRYSSLTP